MKRISIVCVIGFISVLSFDTIAQESQNEIPQWLEMEWENQTQGSGTWIADNAKFKSENEPYDAYGLQWQYGIGKKSITGRLFVLKDDKDHGTVWEFRVFWNPAEKKAVIQQFGSDGTFGIGEITLTDLNKYKTEEVFTSPHGLVYSSGHLKEYLNKKSTKVTSFIIDEQGNWNENRTYIWKLKEG